MALSSPLQKVLINFLLQHWPLLEEQRIGLRDQNKLLPSGKVKTSKCDMRYRSVMNTDNSTIKNTLLYFLTVAHVVSRPGDDTRATY